MTNNKKYNNTISFPLVPKLQHRLSKVLLISSLFKGLHTLPESVVPARVYENADIQKAEIRKENKGKAGIYRWVNLKNGKCYVGSGADLSKRLALYYSDTTLRTSLKKYKSAIYSSMLKYGPSGFRLEILEYCEKVKAVILSREQYYIDLLKPLYNLLQTAGSPLGYKHTEETLAKFRNRVHTEETKKKIRKLRHTEEVKQTIRLAALNRNISEDTKAKISASLTGLKRSEETKQKLRTVALGRKHSEETKVKIREYKHTDEAKKAIGASRLNRKHSDEAKAKISCKLGKAVTVTNIETGVTVEYASIKSAALGIEKSYDTCKRHIKSQKPIKGLYLIKNK